MVSDGDANETITIDTINPVDDPAIIIGDFNQSILEMKLFGDLNATDIDGFTDGSYYTISSHPLVVTQRSIH